MFNIVWTQVNSFGKDRGEILLIQKQQTNIAGKRCLHTGIKRPLMATANAVREVFVVVVSIYLHHLRHLYVFCTIQCY